MLTAALCITLAACDAKQPQSSVTPPAQGVLTTEQVFADAAVLDYNPLTGEPLAEGVSAGLRPVAVMVNNAQVALPQRGVNAADAVVEMVTEGGITRLLALYANPAAMPQVGPVRSARDQHVQFAIPVNAILVHIGTSIYADNLLGMYSYQTVNGQFMGPQAFWFDAARATTRATEHCWYTDAALTAAGIAEKKIETTGKSYPLTKFVKNGEAATQMTDGDAPDVQFSFSDTNTVRFTYDTAAGLYRKSAYGEPHIDETTGEQLAFKNVLVLFAEVGMKPDAYCSDFNLSSGTGYYLYEGKYREIQWKKGNPENPLEIRDAKTDKVIAVNQGKSYLGVVGSGRAPQLVMDINAVTPVQGEAESAPVA